MIGTMSISPVQSAADQRAFCEFPYCLYRDDPCWIPPLRSSERQRWSSARNASLAARWCRRFLLRAGGKVVGRVAAIVDPGFCRLWAPDTGFFGFFECIEDSTAAANLFAAVEDALREKGKSRMLGPVNLTTHDEVGLLVDGFNSPPMILSPYNPHYYEALFDRCGLSPHHDYHAYAWEPSASHTRAVDRLLDRVSRGQRSSGCARVRHMDAQLRDDENRLLFELYNATFAANWGFVPLTWREYGERSAELQSFYRPEYVTFAEVDGRAVGFAMTLPDVNEALAKARGRLFPIGWLRLGRAIRHLGGVRLILLGVLPEFRGRGIAVLLANEQAKAVRHLGARRAELSLVQESNSKMRRVIDAFGGVKCKTYRLFQKAFC
jgi:GNAT superfamily N-acetyltransferase